MKLSRVLFFVVVVENTRRNFKLNLALILVRVLKSKLKLSLYRYIYQPDKVNRGVFEVRCFFIPNKRMI